MKKSHRLAAVAAFAAPIALGWAYTGGADALNDLNSDHSVDEWNVGDYVIEREELDGAVTMTFTDADGNPVEVSDLPPDIAAEAKYFEDNWEPNDVDPYGTQDGMTCYHSEEAAPGEEMFSTWDDNGVLRAYESTTTDEGVATERAMEWSAGELSEADYELLSQGEGTIDDVPAGLELEPCDQ